MHLVHQQPLAHPTRRVGRNQAGARLALLVDLNERAAVDAGLVGPPALRRAAVVNDLRTGLRRASIVPAAKRPVVQPAGLQHRQIGLAVGDGDRVEAGRVGLEIAGRQGRRSSQLTPATRATARASRLHEHFLDPAARKMCTFFGSRTAAGQASAGSLIEPAQ